MKFQAIVESLQGQMVTLNASGHSFRLPRTCLPEAIAEADALDMVVFVNQKETERRLRFARRWLTICGAMRADESVLSHTLKQQQ